MSKRFNDTEDDDETQCNKKIKLCDRSSQSSGGNVKDIKDDVFLPGNSEQSNPSLLSVPFLDDENSNEEIRVNLLSLSDDVLLIILKKLHPFDLLRTSRTCTRLNSLCHDRTLWIDVDFRHERNDKRYVEATIDFNDFIEFLLPNTRSIKKSGCGVDFSDFFSDGIKTTQVSITPSFLKNVNQRVRSLKTFALENHIIFGPTVTLECLSPSIEHLSLKNSLVISLPTDKSYFYKIDKILPNLTTLDLSGCEWFRSHSFLALSKSSTLKELRLKGCRGIMDCVPYASLAATFGFPALELLDLRLTHVNDSDISCFNRVEKLKKLYLEWAGGENKITDIGVTSFGIEPINANNLLLRNADPLVFVLGQNRSKALQSALETLVLKNYCSITDISLKHAAGCLLNLKHLDVRGTNCTRNGVDDFKRRRPEVEILTDFSLNVLDENFAFPS